MLQITPNYVSAMLYFPFFIKKMKERYLDCMQKQCHKSRLFCTNISN